MKKISRTNRFKKDVKKMKKRGKSFDVFKQVIKQLAQGERMCLADKEPSSVRNESEAP